MKSIRFFFAGYDVDVHRDPIKKKLLEQAKRYGAIYMDEAQPHSVDIIVLNRNYFKQPSKFGFNLQNYLSTDSIKFIENSSWLQDCCSRRQLLNLKSYEILPFLSGGAIFLDSNVLFTDFPILTEIAALFDMEASSDFKWKLAVEGTYQRAKEEIEKDPKFKDEDKQAFRKLASVTKILSCQKKEIKTEFEVVMCTPPREQLPAEEHFIHKMLNYQAKLAKHYRSFLFITNNPKLSRLATDQKVLCLKRPQLQNYFEKLHQAKQRYIKHQKLHKLWIHVQ